jgi:hypothetical protein
MNISKASRSILAAVLTVSLATPGMVLAGGGHRDGGHDRSGYSRHYSHQDKGHYKGYRNKGHYKGHYKGHRNKGKYYGGHYGSRYYKYGNHHYHHDDDDDDDLWIGLAVGGLLGYVIGDATQGPTYVPQSYQPATVYPSTTTVVHTPAYQEQTCLQEREYQTKVIVGGRQVDAYGTACLQPDGSWLRGPAQAAAY